ncbi:MAG: hypothetical protein ACTHMS_07225 [Jatrophihabitans sp.]|uniref:hypothetical protein n=1 Tax=Jatrophihabitans sp. TaxID=1932789 RepID=UPI003F7E673E
MLPTLGGRIQSRLFFLATIGSIFTFIMASILPASIGDYDVPWKYRLQDGFAALLWTAILGVLWECVYHFLMQWRWEKDWPTFFGFITFLNEGIVVFLLADYNVLPGFAGRNDVGVHIVPFWFFWPLFVVVWMAVWIWVNGPMRVFNIRWRFFGGRLV